MFSRSVKEGVVVWSGNPSCQTAHDYLLKALKEQKASFLARGTPLDKARKGNLGEFIAMRIGRDAEMKECRVIAANANNPLSAISRADIDLLWVFLGHSPDKDFAIIQEVKTTGKSSLGYADRLIDDYAKLFDTDVQFTLQTRINVAANSMEGMGVESKFCCRVRELGGVSPQTSPGIRLIPTLVHEKNGAHPVPKLVAVKSTIISEEGWSAPAVQCWSVALEELNDRLKRLTWGEE